VKIQVDIGDTVAIIISVLALALSGVTFWNDALKPFRLTVQNAGRVELTLNPYRAPSREPALMAELIFGNSAARSGALEDVALAVRFPGGEHVLFRSMVVSTDRTQQLGKELGTPRLESFVGFNVAGRETVVRHIMFVLEKPGQFTDFPVGRYSVDVLALASGSTEWARQDNFTFAVDKADLATLAKTAFTLQPDGRYYVNWSTQSKVTEEREAALKALHERLAKSK